MKATGIVRRIDDLGRIVIPKEIRKTLKIQEGSPLEIFTDSEGSVIFRKYSPIGEMASLAEFYTQTANSVLNRGCVICDTDRVIAVSGLSKKELIDKSISNRLREIIAEKTSKQGEKIVICDGSEKLAVVTHVILSSGDPMGAVMLIEDEGKKHDNEELSVEIVKTLAILLGKQGE